MSPSLTALIVDAFSAVLVIAGAFFYIAGTVGLLRLPDIYTRLHALTKADNLGLGLIILGLLPQAPGPLYAAKLVLLWLLVLVAGATGAHLIAKRALRRDGEDPG
jgi:multicomponent Na+:H+ antiporter subunit G